MTAHSRWVALALALLSQWSISLVLQAPAPLAPLFQPDLGLTKVEVGFLASATSAGAWVMALAGGVLTDRFGIRRTMALGLTATGLFLLSMSLVTTFPEVIAVMFVAGMGRGIVAPSSTKAVLEWFSPTERATAMGVKQLGLPIAGVMAASALPAIGLALGWRTAIAVPGFLIVCAGLVAGVLYREAAWLGTIPARSVGLRIALGELLQTRSLLALCLVAFCYLIAQLALLSYLPLYFAEIVLVSKIPDEATRILAAGAYLAFCQAGGALGRVCWGIVSDKLLHGKRLIVLAAIGALSAVLSVVVAAAGSGPSLELLAVMVLGYGAVATGWPGIYNAALTEIVGRSRAATGVGLSMTLTEVGTIAGPPLFGLVVDSTQSYQAAWTLLGMVCGVGSLVAILMARCGAPTQVKRSW